MARPVLVVAVTLALLLTTLLASSDRASATAICHGQSRDSRFGTLFIGTATTECTGYPTAVQVTSILQKYDWSQWPSDSGWMGLISDEDVGTFAAAVNFGWPAELGGGFNCYRIISVHRTFVFNSLKIDQGIGITESNGQCF
jgi:hypothetical protein